MQVQSIQKYEGSRGWWSKFRYPLVLTQVFIFNNNYNEDVNFFINDCLRPRTSWLIDQKIKCRVRYLIEGNPGSDHMDRITLTVEFKNPKFAPMYKLSWA